MIKAGAEYYSLTGKDIEQEEKKVDELDSIFRWLGYLLLIIKMELKYASPKI